MSRDITWWAQRDSNPRHLPCKGSALAELSYAPDKPLSLPVGSGHPECHHHADDGTAAGQDRDRRRRRADAGRDDRQRSGDGDHVRARGRAWCCSSTVTRAPRQTTRRADRAEGARQVASRVRHHGDEAPARSSAAAVEALRPDRHPAQQRRHRRRRRRRRTTWPRRPTTGSWTSTCGPCGAPAKPCVPVMREQGSGVIINISSIASIARAGALTAYKMSKAGVNALTQNLALTNAKYGIRVNAIMPGLMDTPMAVERIAAAGGVDREQLIADARAARCRSAARGHGLGRRQRRAVPRLGRSGVHHRRAPARRRWPERAHRLSHGSPSSFTSVGVPRAERRAADWLDAATGVRRAPWSSTIRSRPSASTITPPASCDGCSIAPA